MDDKHQQHIPEGYEPGSDADIHVTSILFVGIIGAVLTIVIVLLLKALYYKTLNEERAEKLGTGTDVQLANVRTAQLEQLARYRWVDARGGKVGIPIDDAMGLVVSELVSRPNNGIDIADWNNYASDQHPTPGNMVMLGAGPGPAVGQQPPLKIHQRGAIQPGEIKFNVENLSGTEHVPADAIVERPAERVAEEHAVGEGDQAAGGDH